MAAPGAAAGSPEHLTARALEEEKTRVLSLGASLPADALQPRPVAPHLLIRVFIWCVRVKYLARNKPERKEVARRGRVFQHAAFAKKAGRKITDELQKLWCEAERA